MNNAELVLTLSLLSCMYLLVLCSDQDSEIWREVEGRRTLMKSDIASFASMANFKKKDE